MNDDNIFRNICIKKIISNYHFNTNLLLKNKILFFEKKNQLIIGRINKQIFRLEEASAYIKNGSDVVVR